MSEQYDKFGTYTRNGEEHVFNFKTSLDAADKIYFVNSVTDILVGDNYNYIIRDLVFYYIMVDVFTDVDISYINESSDVIGEIEKLIKETNIIDVLDENVDIDLIVELSVAVDRNIEYRTGIHKNPIVDSIASLISVVENKIANIDIDNAFEMANMLKGISGNLTPEKILEAYANTDVFKNKYASFEERMLGNNE